MTLGIFKVQSSKKDCKGNTLTHLELTETVDSEDALAVLTKRNSGGDEYLLGEL